MDTAKTILEQLGGNRFIAMTGAKMLVNHGDALSFRLPRGTTNKANHVKVTLDALDTHTVTFTKIRGTDFKEVSSHEGVYNDSLQEVFTSETGLFTRF
ncbi:MAG: hypothetical protein COA62_15900 [Rhodobiaceae bacterium]|nr:MAG: hypothetical protein COA62_15900 [Rhodobiaceae bacterium]